MSDKIDDSSDASAEKAVEESAGAVAARTEGDPNSTASQQSPVPDNHTAESEPSESRPAIEPESPDTMTVSPAKPSPENTSSSSASSGGSSLGNAPSEPSSPGNGAPRKGSSAIAWLALLLVLGVAGAATWVVQQGMLRESQLSQRLSSLETSTASEIAAERDTVTAAQLSSLESKLSGQIQAEVEGLKAEVATQDELQAQGFDALSAQLRQQQEKLASFSANDRDSWLRAEAQYLLRLANQRLIMAGDVESAQALLASADTIVRELNDPGLHDVRAALAAEQAALRAVPKIDVEGLYLRLSALIEQADRLVIFQMQEIAEQPKAEVSDDWQVRLERGYEEAVRKLSDYVVIRRRDVPMHALMDPQWEGLVRQNLRMLLEQAQVALLSQNQSLYAESLQRSQHWVAQFFDTDEVASRAMAREIAQLEGQVIAVKQPDLGRSMRALDEAVKRQLQQGGAE